MGLLNRLLMRIFEPNAQQHLEEILKETREASKSGNVDYVDGKLSSAQWYATDYELQLSDGEIKYIREIARDVELRETKQWANESADEGSPVQTIVALKRIKEIISRYSGKSNDIWANNVLNRAYLNGIDTYFKAAEASMEEGWCGSPWHLIYRARICAEKVGVDIKQKEKEFFTKYSMATHPDYTPRIFNDCKADIKKELSYAN